MLGPTSNIHCAALGDDSAAYFAGPLGEFDQGRSGIGCIIVANVVEKRPRTDSCIVLCTSVGKERARADSRVIPRSGIALQR